MKTFFELREKTLTPAEIKKRKEVADAIKRDNPDMPMAKKMAIATATAKKVAEATLRLDVNKASNDELKQYVKKSSVTIARSSSVHPDVMHTHNAAQNELKKRQRMQEEVEELDELNKSTLGSYIKKANVDAMKHAQKSGEYNNPDQPKHFSKAMDRMRGVKKATDKLVAKEEVELDEAKLSASQRDRLDDLILNVYTTTHPEYDGNDTPQKYLKAIEKEFGAKIAKQVDDGSYQMHFGRDNESSGHDKLASRQWSSKFKGGPRVTAAGKMNKQDVGALKTRIKNDKKFGGLLKSVKLPEEVEQIDELDKKTLGSYIKKASGSAAGLAAITTAQAMSSKGKSDDDDKRQLRNRFKGIARATDKLTKEEVELDEISRDLARRYIRKVADKTNTGELSTKEVEKRRPGLNLAGKKAYPSIAGKARVTATEEVEKVDEVSVMRLGQYTTKAAQQGSKRVAGQWMADQKLRKRDGYSSSAKVAATSTPKKD